MSENLYQKTKPENRAILNTKKDIEAIIAKDRQSFLTNKADPSLNSDSDINTEKSKSTDTSSTEQPIKKTETPSINHNSHDIDEFPIKNNLENNITDDKLSFAHLKEDSIINISTPQSDQQINISTPQSDRHINISTPQSDRQNEIELNQRSSLESTIPIENYNIMTVSEKIKLNHNVFLIKLESQKELPTLEAFTSVRIFDDQNNSKSYTPLNGTNKSLLFAIKVYTSGKISNFIASKDIGDEIVMSDFSLRRKNKPNEFKNVLMIAGGTGITPMYQILNESFNNPNVINKTDYTLLFLNKTKNDIFLYSQLEKLKKQSFGKLHLIHVLSREIDADTPHYIFGKLSKDSLLKITHSKLFEFVYICGTPSLYESFSGKKISKNEQGKLEGALKEIGYTEDQVYKL